MNDLKEQSFLEYWNEVETALKKGYALSSLDAGMEPEEIAVAQESGWQPGEFVKWFAGKYDLTPVGGTIDLTTQTRIKNATPRGKA